MKVRNPASIAVQGERRFGIDEREIVRLSSGEHPLSQQWDKSHRHLANLLRERSDQIAVG